MIIPNDIYPTWSNRDVMDANVYTEQRFKLWLANKSTALWPQVFSWMVTNIYPADPTRDYRFESNFANKAILVTFNWDNTGRGCNNASCYRTYPTGRMCTRNDPPTMFPSGEYTDVVACSPGCYMKRRLHDLHQRLPTHLSLIDKNDPRRCVECHHLSSTVTHHTRIKRLDGRYELYDSRDGSRRIEALDSKNVGTKVHIDQNQHLQTDTDTPFLMWDQELRRCTIPNEFAFQQVVEPWWRDPSHSVCRVTNFRYGNDPIWGYRPKHIGQDDPRDFSFLVRNSRTYCRAFAKNWNNKDGSCEQTLLDKIVSYTLAGDALQRWVKRIVDGDWGCADDKWVPIAGERTREVDPTISTSANHYVTWRGDINVNGFKLPPPNVLLSDLGIDVRLTGNRLYWNSHEGIVSQFPLFNAVESYLGDKSNGTPHRRQRHISTKSPLSGTRYRNYNPLFYDKILSLTTKKQNKPSEHSHDRDDKSNNENSDNNNAELNNEEDINRAFHDLELALYQKRGILETRLREKRDPHYVLRTDDRDRQLDERISKQVRELRHVLSKQTIASNYHHHDNADTLLRANTTSVTYSQNLPEYITQRYLETYLQDDNVSPSHRGNNETTPNDEDDKPHFRHRPSKQAPRTITPATTADNNDLDELIQHINTTKNKNQFWEAMKEIGIGVSEGVGEILLSKALRFHYKKLLQVIAHESSGNISRALLKVGLRIGEARIAGVVISRITTRALMAIGSFASGVGLIIGAVQLLGLVFDIAGMTGWDPGNYNSETDLAVYRDIADFFNYAKESSSRGPLMPFELMTLLTSVSHAAENSERIDGNGTANIDESSLSSLLPSPAKPVEIAKNDQNSHEIDDDKLSIHDDSSLHIDERVSVPKWFNRDWKPCFERQNAEDYVTINDEQQAWTLIVLFDYLGSLSTNSYGQRIMPDPVNVRLNDDDMANLFIEADYRDLITHSSSSSVDNVHFNKRVDSSVKISHLMFIGSLASLIVGIGFAVRYNTLPSPSLVLILAPLVLVLILAILVLCFSLALLPITRDNKKKDDVNTPSSSHSRLSDSSSTSTPSHALDTWVDTLHAIARFIP